ncbi:HupE/UreJ family protein [Variovorax humicola]|uniref:HupE/UreJ family protein n=1 Tax=Variovorax humicola TaxID=1769758 RepID=A0ABU8WA01_9BURK
MTQHRLDAPMSVLLVGLFGLFHGHAHGGELAGKADAELVLGGLLAASLLLHAAGLRCLVRCRDFRHLTRVQKPEEHL